MQARPVTTLPSLQRNEMSAMTTLPNAPDLSRLGARRAASRRLPPLACGCADPWLCRCYDPEPSDRDADAYLAAVRHLFEHELAPALLVDTARILWRRGPAERAIVSGVASRWVA